MIAPTAFLARRCARSIPLSSQVSPAAFGYIQRKQSIGPITGQYFPRRTMSSAKSLEEKIKILEGLSACDVRLTHSRSNLRTKRFLSDFRCAVEITESATRNAAKSRSTS